MRIMGQQKAQNLHRRADDPNYFGALAMHCRPIRSIQDISYPFGCPKLSRGGSLFSIHNEMRKDKIKEYLLMNWLNQDLLSTLSSC